MAAIQGRKGELWVASGTGTAMTAEACEAVGASTTRFHVTDADKRYLDPATTVQVYDDAVLQTSGYHIEGGCHIVFDSAPTSPVTVTAAYLTPAEITLVQGWELSIESEVYDITSLGDTARTYQGSGILAWSGSFERFYESGDGDNPPWYAKAAANASKIIVRLFEDHPSGYCWTGWVTPVSWGLNVPMELERETFGFTGEGMPVYTTDES